MVTSESDATRPISDWAERFFFEGWRHGQPWIVIERTWHPRTSDGRIKHKGAGGWAFDAVSHRVLRAEQIGIHASGAQVSAIVRAIRDYPAQRAAFFAEFERPIYERNGYPPRVIARMSPRSDAPLTAAKAKSIVLIVESAAAPGGYRFLGYGSSFDPQFEALVRRYDVQVDDAIAALILFTCHGKPDRIDLGSETSWRRRNLPSALSAPFHPKRFGTVFRTLRRRASEDPTFDIQQELLKLLYAQVPAVVASLRTNPPRRGRTLHAAARSRLAELATTDALGSERRIRKLEAKSVRTPRTPNAFLDWWIHLESVKERAPLKFAQFQRSLTESEVLVLRHVRSGKKLPRRPSTARVHLRNALVKFKATFGLT